MQVNVDYKFSQIEDNLISLISNIKKTFHNSNISQYRFRYTPACLCNSFFFNLQYYQVGFCKQPFLYALIKKIKGRKSIIQSSC